MGEGGIDWSLACGLSKPFRKGETDRDLMVRGFLLLTSQAPAALQPMLLADGTPVPARWWLPSPRVHHRYPEVRGAARARFVAGPLPGSAGRLELVLAAGADRRVIAARDVTAPLSVPRIANDLAQIRARIHELALAGARTEADRRAVDEALSRVTTDARDLAWIKARVLADVHFRADPRGTMRRLGQLGRRARRQGDTAELDRFWQDVREALGPLAISADGYQPALSGHDSAEVLRGVAGLAGQLGDLGYDAFATSGTLLGLIREGDLIGHDWNVDLGVLLTATEHDAAVAQWRALRSSLTETGTEDDSRVHIQLEVAGGIATRLFPAWIREGRLYAWPHAYGDVPAEDLVPVTTRAVHGSAIPVPARPEAMLAANYGPGWAVPDPAFAFDWGRARQRFSHLLDQLRPHAERSVAGYVSHYSLARPTRPRDRTELEVTGTLVLDPKAEGLTPELLVGGTPWATDWGLPSPGLAARFSGLDAAGAARFRAHGLPTDASLLRLIARASDRTLLLGAHRLPAVLPAPPIGGGVDEVLGFVRGVYPEEVRDPADYLALDGALRRVPTRDRDERWWEARLLTDAVYSMHARRTVHALARLRDRYHQLGVTDRWEAFWAELSAAIDPLTVTIHGYNLAMRHRPPEPIWQEVGEAVGLMKGLGFEVSAYAGTLLGMVRDGGLIGHDDDVDLAVHLPGPDPHHGATVWRELRRSLAELGRLDLEYEAIDRPLLRLARTSTLQIDLFPAWCDGDRYFAWPHVHGTVGEDDVFPLDSLEMHGVSVPVPRRPEAYFAAAYGPGWATPDPVFAFDWGAARLRFEPLLNEFRPSWR